MGREEVLNVKVKCDAECEFCVLRGGRLEWLLKRTVQSQFPSL